MGPAIMAPRYDDARTRAEEALKAVEAFTVRVLVTFHLISPFSRATLQAPCCGPCPDRPPGSEFWVPGRPIRTAREMGAYLIL